MDKIDSINDRTIRIEEKLDRHGDLLLGTGTHDPGVVNRLNDLERKVVTKASVAGVTAGVFGFAGAVAAVKTAFEHWGFK